MELHINQQYAKIGLNIQKPSLELRTTQPQIELKTTRPELSIESPRPRMTIDQSQCFADVNRRGIVDFARYNAQQGASDAMAGIARRASEGDMLAKINGITVEQLCADSAYQGEIDYNIGTIPKQPPRIDWDIRPVTTDLKRGTVDLRLHRGTFENNFQRGKVETYLLQKNYLDITWTKAKEWTG
ncbi:MAG: DUF6470 family protein [Bacillota bacterium]|nr:DUF6470 family protein [Bacillota bacterium]